MPRADLKSITLHVANLTARDAHFLKDVIAIFTDPKYSPRVTAVRRGTHAIRYWFTGDARLIALNPQSAIEKGP